MAVSGSRRRGNGDRLFILMIVFFVLITQKSLMRCMKKQSSNMYHTAKESSARRRKRTGRRGSGAWKRLLPERRKRNTCGKKRRLSRQSRGTRRRAKRSTFPYCSMHRAGKAASTAESAALRWIQKLSGMQKRSALRSMRSCRSGADMAQPCRIPLRKKRLPPILTWAASNGKKKKRSAKESGGLETYHEEMPLHIEGIEDTAGKDSRDTDRADTAELPEEENKPAEAAPSSPARKNPRSSKKEIEEGIASVQAEVEKAEVESRPEYVFPPLDLLKKEPADQIPIRSRKSEKRRQSCSRHWRASAFA